VSVSFLTGLILSLSPLTASDASENARLNRDKVEHKADKRYLGHSNGGGLKVDDGRKGTK
jgi:hypothetical protein